MLYQKPLFTNEDNPVYLPSYHGRGGYYKSFKDPAYFRIKEISLESVTIETSEGDRLLQTKEDFLSLFSEHKTNWVGCESLTTFLRWFTSEEVEGLYPPFNNSIPTSNGDLTFIPQLCAFKIGQRTKVIQVDRFAPGFKVDSLDKVKLVAEKMLSLEDHGMILNPVSSSSTSSGSYLGENLLTEFRLVSQLQGKDVKLASDCYYPLRQDNAFIGRLDPLQVVDMVKAFLVRLSAQKSYALKHNVVDRSLLKNPEAHAGWYEIVSSIPSGILFPPLPYRNPPVKRNPYMSLVYPTGLIHTKVCKAYLDLLDDMGIPYQIIKSLQLVSTKPNYYPSWAFCNAMKYILLYESENLKPVDPKTFYFTIIGHMLHTHETLDKQTGEIYETTSADYHPFIASTVSAEVACLVYRLLAVAKNPYFFSADGGGAESFLKVPESFRDLLGTGLLFNPHIKAKPGKKPGKNIGPLEDLIYSQRDQLSLKVNIPVLITPKTSLRKPWKWGTRVLTEKSLGPSFGHREKEDSPERLGELLERTFRSKPSYMTSNTQASSSSYNPLSMAELQALTKLLED